MAAAASVGFLGAGHIATALVRGIIAAGMYTNRCSCKYRSLYVVQAALSQVNESIISKGKVVFLANCSVTMFKSCYSPG